MYAPKTTLATLLLICSVGLLAIFIAEMRPYRLQVDAPLSVQWNNTISKLGIEPLYPPQEDVSVGDIFVVITNDGKSSLDQSFLSRAVKLTNVSLQPHLEETYNNSYIFPETHQKPDKNGDIWKQNNSENSIFEYHGQRKSLPIAMFPGLSLATINQGNLEVGGIGGLIKNMFGFESLGVQTTELRIPTAETYGVGSLVANGKLFEFCHANRTKKACTQSGSRAQMASVVGSGVFELIPDPSNPKNMKYRYDLAIFLISRVYMTRSIETIINTSTNITAAATINKNKAQDKSKSDGDKALNDDEENFGNPVFPSSAVEYNKLNSNIISVTQTLVRPVVIGFRSVKSAPLED